MTLSGIRCIWRPMRARRRSENTSWACSRRSKRPWEAVGASLVVKAYFDRWPCEELQFRSMKSFACLNRVAGYGKKKLPDERVRATQEQLQHQITGLRQRLKVPLKQIADQEEQVASAIEKERRIRFRGKVVEGQRTLQDAARTELNALSRGIAASRRQIKAIESQWGKPLRRLRRYEKEWLRLQGKDHVYRIDVELDQIAGFFRIALVNIASWFLSECCAKHPMSLARFLHAILLMPAEIRLTKDVRRVLFKRNLKDPQMMALLEPALTRLTGLNIRDLDDRTIEFGLQ